MEKVHPKEPFPSGCRQSVQGQHEEYGPVNLCSRGFYIATLCLIMRITSGCHRDGQKRNEYDDDDHDDDDDDGRP